MNLYDLAQFGVAIFSVGVLGYVITFVVTKFLDFQRKQEDNFSEIIKNHMHNDMESKNKLEQSQVGLTRAVEQLIRFLEKGNGSK